MESIAEHGKPAVGTSMLLRISEQSQIGAARRSAVALAHAQPLGSDAVGRLAIVVTEAATNIVRHGGNGVIILRALIAGSSPAIEMLALDKGPGIPNLGLAMRDGFSTSGTSGQGLGGMQRLSEVFEVHSRIGAGTVILARVGEGSRLSSRTAPRPSPDDRVGVVCIPMRGETECGDAWRIMVGRNRTAVLLADGLGHGREAAEAAAAATAAFAKMSGGPPDTALTALDLALHGTRGAAVSIAVIDETERLIHFSGAGNVVGRVLTPDRTTEHLVPQNGIVGHQMPSSRLADVPFPRGARLVLHSDGVSARWRMNAYPELVTAHPALLAGVLYRDFSQERDDATVLVVGDGPSVVRVNS